MPTAKVEVNSKSIAPADRMQLLALHLATIYIGLTEYKGIGRDTAFESFGAIKEYIRQFVKDKYGEDYLHQFNKQLDTIMSQVKRDLRMK